MKILFATDGSVASHEAEWFLARLPFNGPIDLTIAHVGLVPSLAHLKHEFPTSVNEMLEQYNDRARLLLAEEAARFEGINGTVETSLLSGNPGEALLGLADDRNSDLIVLGARGLTASRRLLLGSVSLRVAKHAPCSVLVTRPRSHEDSERPLCILVGCDGSDSSRQAVQELAKLHWGEKVEMQVLNIVPSVLPYRLEHDPKFEALWKENYRQAEAVVDWAIEELKRITPHVHGEVRKGDLVTDEIINHIERTGANLVVMVHQGRGRIERFLLGSVSESVLRHAPCSVWIVRKNESATT